MMTMRSLELQNKALPALGLEVTFGVGGEVVVVVVVVGGLMQTTAMSWS